MTKHDTFIRELKERHVTVFSERETTYNSGLIYSVIDELVSIKRTARGSMSQSFRLRDPSWTHPNYKRGVSITLFHKEDGAIANDAQVGDILVVHDVQVTKRPEFMQLTTNRHTKASKWCYIDCKSLKPRITPDMVFQLTENDIDIAKILKNWWMTMKSNTTMPASPSNTINAPTSYSPAFKTTEQMECAKFCGYIGKVVTSQWQKENLLQLVLTDFTPNKLPMTNYYESQDTIPSELLIQATLWDENATACPDIQNGDYVELRNAQIKLSKLGYMELSVRGDRISGKRIPKIKKINNVHDDPRVKAIMQREDEFWKEVMPSLLEEEDAIESVHTVVGGNVSIFTVEQILDDPDHTDKEYAVHAAVMDVKPRNLRDWIKKWCPQCEWIEELDSHNCSQCHQPINEYNLMSALLLQDNHGRRLQLQIYGEEAKAMFPNLTPIRPEEDYVCALKENIDRILSVNPEKPELYLNIGVKSYMAIANNRQFRLRDTVFRFD